jgi:hypothetical protein
MKVHAWLAGLTLTANLAMQAPAAVLPLAPPEARQFDFWIGEWEVFLPDGKKAGENRIEKVANDWGLLENWNGGGGYSGKSLNTWISERKRWQQFWVGSGDALELSGGLNAAGEMVLEGRSIGAGAKETRERITWTPNADGTVRQHWQQSSDGGATWTTAFDGLYRRRENKQAR